MTRLARALVAAALAAPLALAAAAAAGGSVHYAAGYRCSTPGHRYATTHRHRYARHGAAWRHHRFRYSGYYGGPGIRRSVHLGYGTRYPTCHWVGTRARGLLEAYPAAVPPRPATPDPARTAWWLDTPPPAAATRPVSPAAPATRPAERTAPPDSDETPRPIAPEDAEAETSGPPDPAVTTPTGAWRLLSEGALDEARREFAVQALRHPRDLAPKVGFALASSMTGREKPALRIMRRVFAPDAPPFRALPIDVPISGRMLALVDRYERQRAPDLEPAEALFMSAALGYLLGDLEPARRAIDAAVDLGDDHPSTLRLRELLSAP